MANQTVASILGLNDNRKQISFNLSPETLRPTLGSAGQYPVLTPSTPKTNALLELSENIKRGVTAGKSFANIQQALGSEQASSIASGDAEEELNRLKAEEPETFMNMIRQRSYKNSLMEKHIRLEMIPKVQSDIYGSANANQFKSEKDFNNYVDGQLESAWEDFSGSVGEEIANSMDAKAVWTGLTDTIRGEADLKYYESRDAVALLNEEEAIESRLSAALSDVDTAGNTRKVDYGFVPKFTKATVNTLMENHGVSRSAAMKKMRDMMLNQAEVLSIAGQYEKASKLRAAMDATVSDDGVSLYDSNDTAKRAARLDKDIREGIESANDIDNDVKAEYVGQMARAYRQFQGGQSFDNLTPNEKKSTLAPFATLDPNYTMEQLEKDMSGQGLPAFNDLRLKLSQGSDFAQSLDNQTYTAIETHQVTASSLRGRRVHVKDTELQAEYVEKFRNKVLLDEDYTLQKFLDDENIATFDTLDTEATSLEKTSDLRKSSIYKEVDTGVLKAFKELEGTLKKNESLAFGVTPASIINHAESFSKNIQRILLEEVEAGTLEPSEYQNRRDKLVGIATSNLEQLITMSEISMGDIMMQEENTPDKLTAQGSFIQPVENKEKGLVDLEDFSGLSYPLGLGIGTPLYSLSRLSELLPESDKEKTEFKPFGTLLSKFKTLQIDTGRKAFGFINVKEDVQVKVTDEDIARDRKEMLKNLIDDSNPQYGAYREALALSLNMYGTDYNEDPETTMRLLNIAGADAVDVPIFSDNTSIRMFTEDVNEITNKMIKGVEALSKEEERIIEDAGILGLIPPSSENFKEQLAERIRRFENSQSVNIKAIK